MNGIGLGAERGVGACRSWGAVAGPTAVWVKQGASIVKAKLAVLSLGLFVLTGCGRSLVGKWTLDKNSPDLKEAKTIIKSIEFTEDGVYSANVMETKDGLKKAAMRQGKYKFNGFQLKLTSKDDEQVWNALLYMTGRLDLNRSGDKLRLNKMDK